MRKRLLIARAASALHSALPFLLSLLLLLNTVVHLLRFEGFLELGGFSLFVLAALPVLVFDLGLATAYLARKHHDSACRSPDSTCVGAAAWACLPDNLTKTLVARCPKHWPRWPNGFLARVAALYKRRWLLGIAMAVVMGNLLPISVQLESLAMVLAAVVPIAFIIMYYPTLPRSTVDLTAVWFQLLVHLVSIQVIAFANTRLHPDMVLDENKDTWPDRSFLVGTQVFCQMFSRQFPFLIAGAYLRDRFAGRGGLSAFVQLVIYFACLALNGVLIFWKFPLPNLPNHWLVLTPPAVVQCLACAVAVWWSRKQPRVDLVDAVMCRSWSQNMLHVSR